ncbi:hypothetical protein SOVF_196370 isoform B [Spinacia oleracea]|nr:hypothetical protein SOVF_196370 isoform B [Spinacia oleracea]
MDLDDSGPAVMNRSSGDESGLKISLTPRTMPRSHQCHYSLERKSPVMPRGLSVSCAAKPKMVTEVSDIVKSQLVLAEDAKVTGETKFSEIGADSLDTVEIVMKFEVTVEEENAQTITNTSASLKFTVLNPKGRIWTMVAGGGASVIYADTVGDEALQYAKVVIDCATADPDGRKRTLVVGGGIANFTDVAATFNGIIKSLKEKESKLKAARMHISLKELGYYFFKGTIRD